MFGVPHELVSIVSELYAACSVEEIETVTYLAQGRLAPFFAPVEIGLGERLLLTAMAMAYGSPMDEVDATYLVTLPNPDPGGREVALSTVERAGSTPVSCDAACARARGATAVRRP